MTTKSTKPWTKRRNEFKARLQATIEDKYMQIMQKKPHDRKWLGYVDLQEITHTVRGVFRKALRNVPGNVEFTCRAAEAVLAPSTVQRIQHIKAMQAAAGGAAGIGAILTGLAGIFGWGAGVLWSIKAFFIGVALGGPIGWIAGGIGIATIALYFALNGGGAALSKKAFDGLKDGCDKAVDGIWHERGAALSRFLDK
jgi:hypothetical protein